MEVGFEGVVSTRSSVFPVAITIDNKVASTTGRIEISQPDASGNSEARQVLPFTTPAPSRKRFVLLTRIERSRNLELTVVFTDHIKTIRRKLNVKRNNDPLVLCLGVPRSYRLAGAAGKYTFVTIEKHSLPSDPVALDGVHAVMLSGPVFASLSAAQLEAMRQWTVTGGTLIFVEMVADEAFRRNFESLTGMPGMHVPVGDVARLGAGIIAASDTDAELGRVFWDGDEALTRRLFPAVAEDDRQSYAATTGFFSKLWQTKRSYGLAGLLSIIIIIVTYICAIGPMDRWLVKRLKKPYLTWVFFPVAIAAFSVIAYGYSSMANVGTMRAVYANVVDVAPGFGVAKGNSLMWVYSAKNATYTINTSLKDVCFSARESILGAGAVAGVDIANGRDSTISARIPVFSSKEFGATWFMPWSHEIACQRDGQVLSFIVPEALNVNSAYMASEEGLINLTKKGQAWVAEGNTTPWETIIVSRAGALSPHWHFRMGMPFGTVDDERLMPSSETLQSYLLCMSFPWEVSPDNVQNAYQALYYRQSRDYRERSMDIRCRLKGGRTLLLFLEPTSSLLPIRIRWNSPTVMQVNLVRFQVPESI